MAYKFREEIVGKRFLSVSSDFSKLKVNKISEWGWRSGVIRAASHRDNNCHDLQVLVEYDDVEWHRREWLSPHRDTAFTCFLIEKGLFWAERIDPRQNGLTAIDQYNHNNHTNNNHRINGKSKGSTSANTVAWPAIAFYPLVAREDLHEDMMPVEFINDKKLEFVDYDKLKPFTQDWELTKASLPWANSVRRWAEMQDGQRILLTTPSVLVGFRVEVYRAEGTTQWYTAVIVGYNESTKDLTVTDDTVLEEHNEDPRLVQMRLIGDGVVESIMRGEVVGMTPRRSRSSTGLMTHAIVVPRVPRRPRGRPVTTSLTVTQPVSQQLEKDKGIGKKNRTQKVNEVSVREKTESRQEDRENKGPVISSVKPSNRGPRSSVLEETNSLTKLRKRGAGGTGAVTGGSAGSGSGAGSGVGLKNPETNRRVRGRRGRPTDESRRNDRDRLNATTKDKEPVRDQDHLRSEDEGETEEEETVEGGEEEVEDESEEESDSKLKTRLRSARQDNDLNEDKKEVKQEKHQEDKKFKEKKKVEESNVIADTSLADVKPEEDESESRERDREPEPPPSIPDTLDPGGDDCNITCSKTIITTTATTIATAISKEVISNLNSDSVTKLNLSTSPSDKQASELVERTNKDGSVLERLSPLNAGPGRLNLLHDEQERSRHNESPVILAERINKPPVSASGNLVHQHQHHHHQQQQLHHQHQEHQQHLQQYQHLHPRYTSSPVIHRLDSVSPHSQHRAPYPSTHHQHHQHQHSQQQQQHQSNLETSDKSQASNHHLVQHQQQQQQHHHQLSSSRHGDEAGHIMEMETGGNGAGGFPGVPGVVASGVRGAATYGDSGSDSGISSLRSAGSGDERSGSRSSALSAEETTATTTTTPAAAPAAAATTTTTVPPSPAGVPTTPARIWHVHSVQHTSLMMAHTPQSTGSTIPVSAPPVGYQSPAAVAAATAASHHHHPSAEMLWRPPRYPPLPHGLLAPGQPMPAEELLERDRHERIIRERREAEARELEKQQQREAKMDLEKLEKQKAAEQAVHKHFEESFRLAHQRRNMSTASAPWSNFVTLPPPGSRSHGAPPSHAGLPSHGHHHPGPGGATHPSQVTSQQQQHQQQQQQQERQRREREEHDARERERERDVQAREREREHLAAAERLHRQAEAREHHRAAAYYAATAPSAAQQVLRPSSVPSKVEYPPPPAHSRTSKSSLSVVNLHDKQQVVGPPHSSLPKAEPNVSLFSYSGYPPPQMPSYVHDIKVKNDLQLKPLPGKSLGSHERDHHGRELVQNQPPQLLSDHKSSVIVKNDQGRGNDLSKVPPPHSSSPKMMSYMVQPVAPPPPPPQVPPQPTHKTPVAYEYRSPTQSPHHLHHLESLQAKGIPSHHRSASGHNQSPHGHPSSHSHNRQSPHSQPHPHQTPHPSPPESRYLNRPEPGLLYASSKPSYSYPHQPNASPTSHYTAPPGSKPKVSSPAPPHIYGNPGPGILTGTPVCRASEPAVPAPLPLTSKATGSSPYQQVPHHHGSAPPSRTLPPPAHTRPPYDSRGLPVGSSLPVSKLPPPLHTSPSTVGSAALSRPTVPHPSFFVSPHQSGGPPGTSPVVVVSPAPVLPSVQTQPLDLGVERSVSPKRKASTPTDHLGQSVSLEIKKRRTEEPPTPLSLQCVGPPVLSRVSEPSPLIASAATSITTVVNNALLVQPTTINPTINATTINNNPNNNINNNNNNNSNNNNTSINTENVQTHQLQQQSQSQSQQQQLQQEPAVIVSVSPAPRTASADGSVRPASTGSVSSLHQQQITTSSAPSPAPTASPAPAASAPSPAPPSAPGTPAKTPVNNTDSEKSNSPAPRPPSRTNYPVHKLKKAWLQRHSGEDGTEDTTGVVGSGSCVTLPLNSAQAPSQPLHKERESTTSNSNSTSNTTTSLPSAVNSIHNIGSMAVNSINKTKATGKAGRKPKETLNGHTNDGKNLQEDSSSSDPERKSPPKRKPPKVKRKKGAPRRQQAAVEEQRRKKDDKQVTGSTGSTATATAAGSDSSNESEAGSASDTSEQLTSSSSIQPTPKRNTTTLTNSNTNSNNSTGNGNTNREPRKRGRRPKNSKGNDAAGGEDQPRSKKDRKEDSSSGNGGAGGEGGGNGGNGQGGNGKSNPFCKPPTSQLKKTGDSWLQDLACCEVAPKLAKCRECRYLAKSPLSRIKKQTVFCRFYAFRRLRYTKNGQLAIAGFSDPLKDASEEDVQLWLPGNLDQHSREKDEKTEKNDKDKGADRLDLDKEMAYRLLRQVGDQFCDLLRQEKEALSEHIADADNGLVDSTVAWKRVVQGVREMCDVCETTLFNYHWVCAKCGFAVCIDCFKGRKNGTVTIWGESGKDRDDFGWLLCTNRQVHAPDRLMLTQIIAGDSLPQLGQRLHDVRAEWGIPQHCDCSLVSSTPPSDVLRNSIKGDSVTVSTNGNIKQEIKEEKSGDTANGSSDSKTNGEENSPLNWLADVALQNQDKNDSGSSSDSDEDRDGNYSTLRELLIRPSHKPNGTGSRSNSPTNVNSPGPTSNNIVKQGKKSKMDALDEVISSVIEHTAKEEREAGESGEKTCELKHFVRRYKWTERGREPLPIRIMTLTESKSLYPDVPHSWLCNGKLLRLNEPHNVNNYRIFQDQWKRGQPVIVSDVSKSLNMDLWHPDSFARDFGDEKNDLINCMTGHTVPHQPMRKFWEGFEHFGKRLKDDKGNPMLLKLKDWPPGEDFAELLPSRYADLMKVLPLSEYTHRNGRLNLASRLPDCFVRPDLGPKMYNAYGSALYSNKGTTNLHLDISDAVNVMVYVGIPQDGDSEEHIKEALRAVDEAGCDILTRRRVRERGEAPGALWHIYAARDADKIRDLLNAVALERGARLEPHHDPIHDQSCYLDGHLRERLYREYGVEGYAIVQCLGDAVFVPAGAPHQVRNLHNCIKVAEDFVSPENVSHCFHLTQEFRALSDTHTNHEDKLQIKNIIYHAVKDSLTVLANAKEEALQATKAKSSEVKVKDEPKRET
ncbi:probable JmjC domain-containing histone demethylation protein 2C isoform X2 [Microplitis mediator]|uniref:probable JmjC domain-containing histone demethylation protein 2C isoform X2 n=1 Tax=Microplitis mediator TaxID=375433 RepID=UPI00255249BE|nr:probable JmjC domain-containing histone demethylation protein 2C isoform X2 [Microplitis mediator]